ncbi:hypothetical protein VTJ04DRAFT_4541 [Mycothermus thermophilus]|uniref:uncharacterized protein n=1 Tax=Humicola insolens TaxID=85995 RepID=UPI0037423CCB
MVCSVSRLAWRQRQYPWLLHDTKTQIRIYIPYNRGNFLISSTHTSLHSIPSFSNQPTSTPVFSNPHLTLP